MWQVLISNELESLISAAAPPVPATCIWNASGTRHPRARALRVAGNPFRPGLDGNGARPHRRGAWPYFLERRSFDLSRTIRGVPAGSTSCILRADRMAIRLLAAFQATVENSICIRP